MLSRIIILGQLRILVLFNSFKNTLENHCFRNQNHLEQLALNDITSLESDVIVGLHSLRMVTMIGLLLTSYPMQFVSYTRELSLSVIGDTNIPAEYTRLPRPELLDANRLRLDKIAATTRQHNRLEHYDVDISPYVSLGGSRGGDFF